MVTSRRFPLPLLLYFLTCEPGVVARPLDAPEYPFHSLAPERWRRSAAEGERGRCADLEKPWQESVAVLEDKPGTLLQLRVLPCSPKSNLKGLLFPGRQLFSFLHRVFRCCQELQGCARVRGIQGRLTGGSLMEFVLTREVLSQALTRAELHLRLSNPQRLVVQPLLPAAAKRGLPTRYALWSHGDWLQLRVDLLFLLPRLQEPKGRHPPVDVGKETQPSRTNRGGSCWSGGVLDLGLALDCLRDGAKVSCEAGGVQLTQAPFMVVHY